ncbi:MAG: TIGR04282 family arsenosugar biosynthesis glycosyltransferase [Myxococcota bacterium]
MIRGRLGIFAKAPGAGRVKTRLSPPLSAEQAARLYDAMLTDVLLASAEAARRLSLEPVVYFDPPDARSHFEARVPDGFALREQVGPTLAERMAEAFRTAEVEGVPLLLLRGTDSPALDVAHCREAIDRLDRGADVVLTPDQGGGYALIGMKKHHPTLFGIALSTPTVLIETLSRSEKAGIQVRLTRATFDLDVAADLRALDALSPEESSVLCPHTVACVRSLRSLSVL